MYAALAAASPESASAFSNPESYEHGLDLGGGDGRWFTGSPADGFACDVCHEGGQPVELEVSGLPLEGYEAGRPYEIRLTWPLALQDLALVAEFTDEQRKSAGTLALPQIDAYTPPDLCAPDEGGERATNLYPTRDGRMMVAVVDCGSRVSRFQWTAPALAAGPIWFNAGFVASNADTAPTGDGVTLASRTLWPVGASNMRTVATSGCAVASGPRSRAAWPCLLALALAATLRRRRRRR